MNASGLYENIDVEIISNPSNKSMKKISKKSPESVAQRLMIHDSNAKKGGSKISLVSQNLHFVEHERKIGEL